MLKKRITDHCLKLSRFNSSAIKERSELKVKDLTPEIAERYSTIITVNEIRIDCGLKATR